MSGVGSVELPSHEFLSQLAFNDPQGYEAWRREVIEQFISSTPARTRSRLRGLQWRVDCLRRPSRCALGATVQVYQMMWSSFLELNEQLSEFSCELHDRTETEPPKPAPATEKDARIIPFAPPARQGEPLRKSTGKAL